MREYVFVCVQVDNILNDGRFLMLFIRFFFVLFWFFVTRFLFLYLKIDSVFSVRLHSKSKTKNNQQLFSTHLSSPF